MADERPSGDPEFGPRGYLPERAATRARKIVLRSPLGLQWIIASLVAGVVVVIAGVTLLTRGGGPPDPPFVAVAPVAEVAGEVVHDQRLDVLLVGLGGRIRAFDAPADVRYCEVSRRLESPDGGVWSLTGRALAGDESFAEHPTVTSDGQLYVDPTVTTTRPTASEAAAEPGCA
jgi:hypothetical protein